MRAVEIEVLKSIRERHNGAHFERLPSCPLCLEKLDSAVSGLQQTPSLIGLKASKAETNGDNKCWPGVAEECTVCQCSEKGQEMGDKDVKKQTLMQIC